MNPSTAAAGALIGELIRRGVAHLVLAPGSRSAPLAFAAVAAADRGAIRLHVRIDERSAAFTALGLARVSGPVAIVTTSGTAVANLHPAVLEASHARVPLVVLTADRPHELRGTGANQTTDQVRIFGSAVRYFADVPAPYGRPDEDADLRDVLARALASATGARGGDPGPVHLNLAFREPLVPDTPRPRPATEDDTVIAGGPAVHSTGISASPFVLPAGKHTVVVAGDGAGPAASRLAEAGGYPLLAEPSSGARCGPNAMGPYRLLLRAPTLGGRIERAVVFGHPTLSRPVNALLARRDVEVIVVAPAGPWPDAGRNAAHVVEAVEAAPDTRDDRWLKEWRDADQVARKVVDDLLARVQLSGPLIARELWAALRPRDALVVGSSNPIRDLDLVAAPFATADVGPDGQPLVVANRGLSGIDGTLSTASGVALASGRTTRVLLGDLTFLHDAGGLLVGPLEEEPSLQVIVVNDDGGGIFTLLEQGAPEHTQAFERVFGTPHGADLAALSRGYGVAHTRVDSVDRLRRELAAPPPGRSVLEVPVDRAGHRALHARLMADIEAALSG